MLLRLNPDDPRAVYRQIADEIQRCVAVGILKAGEPVIVDARASRAREGTAEFGRWHVMVVVAK